MNLMIRLEKTRKFFDIRATKGLTRNLYTDFGYYKDLVRTEIRDFVSPFVYNWGERGEFSRIVS